LGAGINVERTRELVEAELTNARRGLEFASRSLELAKLRDQELTAYLEAQDRAYQAGELSLLELQRARTEALDARRALVEAQTQVEREISMLNQAWGRLP
jgi:outer membrane protein TolC